MAQVWDCGGLQDRTLVDVLVQLANSGDDDGGNSFPGNKLIAARTRLSPRQVVRAIASLEREGWITIVQRGSGRPTGNTTLERAAYKSQYQINVAKLKECQAVTFSKRRKRVTLKPEKGDMGTQKGDNHDKPPDPHIGVTVLEPSLNQLHEPEPQNASAAFAQDDALTPGQQEHLDRLAAEGVRPGAMSVEDWRRCYAAENREARELCAAGSAKEIELRREYSSDLETAIRRVRLKCGFAWEEGDKLEPVMDRVFRDQLELGRPVWRTASEIADAWLLQRKQGLRLRARFGPVAFIRDGHWLDSAGWHWNADVVAKENAARVGSR
jgi:hypothetical protein